MASELKSAAIFFFKEIPSEIICASAQKVLLTSESNFARYEILNKKGHHFLGQDAQKII